MCIKGQKGIKVNNLKGLTNKYEYFFGEDQADILLKYPRIIFQKLLKY